MATEDLVFNILARDRNAARTLKNVGDAADHSARQVGRMHAAMAALGSVPALGGTAAGGLMALPAAATAGAAALGVLAIAFNGVKDAFSEGTGVDQLVFSGLAREAAVFVTQGQRVNEVLAEFRRETQGRFFAPLEGSFDRIANAYMPMLERRVPALAAAMGDAARSLVIDASQLSNVEKVSRILDSARYSAYNLGRTASEGLGIVLTLGSAGTRAWEKMTANLAGGTRAARLFFAEMERSGDLDRLLETGVDSIRDLTQAIAPLGRALLGLFSSEGTQQAAEDLFDILGLGTQVVAGLVRAFDALPDGLQSGIVTFGVLVLLASRVYTGLKALSSMTAVTAVALETMAGAGAKAAVGVNAASTALSRAAGPVGIAVGLITALALSLHNSAEEAEVAEYDIARLDDAMKVFSRTGKITGELARATGGDFSIMARGARKAEDQLGYLTSAAYRMQQTFDQKSYGDGGFNDYTNQHAENAKRLKDAEKANAQFAESIKTTAHQIAELARGGDIRGASMAADQFRTAFLGAGYSVDWVNEKLAEYLEVSGGMSVVQYDAAEGTRKLQTQQDLLNGSWQEAVNKLGSLKQAFDAFNGVAVTHDQSIINMERSLDNLAEGFKKNGSAMDYATESGRKNRENLRDGISDARDATQAEYDLAVAQGDGANALSRSRSVWNTYIQQLRQAAIDGGVNVKVIDAFLAEYAKMPIMGAVPITVPGAVQSTTEVQTLNSEIASLEGKKVQIQQEGAENADKKVADLQRRIDALQSKRIQIETTIWEQRVYRSHQEFRDEHGYRRGGITPKHARRGLLSESDLFSGGRTMYGFAEPGVGQEAFIARNADLGRSRSIARHVVDDWLGGPGAIWGQQSPDIRQEIRALAAAVMASGGNRDLQITFSGGSSPLEQLLVRFLREYIRVSFGGNVEAALGTS